MIQGHADAVGAEDVDRALINYRLAAGLAFAEQVAEILAAEGVHAASAFVGERYVAAGSAFVKAEPLVSHLKAVVRPVHGVLLLGFAGSCAILQLNYSEPGVLQERQ